MGDLFYIMWNIPAVVGIKSRGHGCKCRIYVWLIVIYLHKVTK